MCHYAADCLTALNHLGHIATRRAIAELHVDIGMVKLEDAVPIPNVQEFRTTAEYFDVFPRHCPYSITQLPSLAAAAPH